MGPRAIIRSPFDLLLFDVKLKALTAAAARSRYPHFNFKLKA
ncbi:hypothetical protein CCACVL1_19221 [Corchorus capsularis]|uniref:Uncharacterized protein n=1 Tax=Corchorus capsularis TaxID=210143 RepID=A0A1R3HHU8_COCAP|nr:hypothetical protein CCACVL1_19221 [Corchorus capsularis]